MRLVTGLITAFFVAMSTIASAVVPMLHDSDGELAVSPVVVIGYWPKARRFAHDKIIGDTMQQHEVRTQLRILKVLHGDAKVGLQPIRYDYGILWNDRGTGVYSGGTTISSGEVKNITKPKIWFLKWGKSWDKRISGRTLTVYSYRCIQDRELLSYYETLRQPDRDRRLRKLLERGSAKVVQRTLKYVSDQDTPWPYTEFWFPQSPAEKPPDRRWVPLLPSLSRVIDGRMPECRALATALFARFGGPAAAPRLRGLLLDREPEVCLIAAGSLVRLSDSQSIPGIERMVKKLEWSRRGRPVYDPEKADEAKRSCSLIRAMERTRDIRYVPSLIQFLETRIEGGGVDKDVIMPALYARQSLEQLTGFYFPFDVARSIGAWRKVSRLTGFKRNARLSALLGT